MLNKCNKGIGCAMQANQKNIVPISKLSNTTTSSVTELQKNFNNNATTPTVKEVHKDFNTNNTTWKPHFIKDTLNQNSLLPVIVPVAPPVPSTCLSSTKIVTDQKLAGSISFF